MPRSGTESVAVSSPPSWSLYDATMAFLSSRFQCLENVMVPFGHRKPHLARGTAPPVFFSLLFLAFDRKLMILNVRLMHNE